MGFMTNQQTFGCGNLQGPILNPDGTTLYNNTCWGGVNTVRYSGALSLSQTGPYVTQLNPSGNATGSVAVAVYTVPSDPTVNLPMNGTATVQTTVPGQVGHMTFTGTASQNVSLNVNSTGAPNCSWWISIIKPDGTSLLNSQACNSTYFMDKTSLPASGTYTISFPPDGHTPTITGTWTANLYNVPADVTGSVVIGGASLAVTIGTPGQNASITFNNSTAGILGTVHISSNTIGNVTVTVLNPDGTQLTSATSSASSFNLPQKTLSQTGTYTIQINPSGPATGSLSVNVTSP
jgi:hypothetical protein